MWQLVLDFNGLTLHNCLFICLFWVNKANTLTTTGIIFVALSVSVCVSRHCEQQKACECIFVRRKTQASCLLWQRAKRCTACWRSHPLLPWAAAHSLSGERSPFKTCITSAVYTSLWITGKVAVAHKSFPFCRGDSHLSSVQGDTGDCVWGELLTACQTKMSRRC